MLNLFKKRDYSLYNPVSGEIISLGNVGDEVLSAKLLGNGFATIPNNKNVYSPIYI